HLYAERALPGGTVARVHVDSLEAASIRDRLDSELTRPWAERAVVAVYDGQTWRTTNGDLAVSPDVDTAIATAVAYGKTGSFMERASAWIDALRGEAPIPLALRAQGDALDRWVASVAAAVDRRAVSGEIALSAKGLTFTDPVLGRELDRVAATDSVLAAPTLDDREIDLHVRAIYPAVDESGYRDAVARATAVVTPLEVTVEDRRIAEDAAALSTLLSIERVAARPGDRHAGILDRAGEFVAAKDLAHVRVHDLLPIESLAAREHLDGVVAVRRDRDPSGPDLLVLGAARAGDGRARLRVRRRDHQ